MSGFSLRLRIAACHLAALGTAFAALGCSGRSAGHDTSSDEADDGDVDDDDDGDDDDDENGDDDDGLTTDPDATADDDGGLMTDPDGDDDGDDDSMSSDDGGGQQNPLEDMGEVEMVAGGFGFAEGPVWVPDSGALLFTDIPADAILRLDPSTDVIEPFVQGTGTYVNGLDLDEMGNLLMCEGGNQRLTRRAMNHIGGSLDVVADTWSGSPFNSPNDVATHESGSIFFTDPTYGTSPDFGGSPPVLGFQGIYRIDAAGELSLVDDSLEQPNGVVISPDGDTLYVADTVTAEVFAYALDGDGEPGARSLLFQVDGADGMTIDSDGNLYVAGAAGIEVWRGDGSERWGIIGMPDVPTNCAFGGEDLRVLYVTLPSQLVRVRLAVPGLENAS